MQDKTGGFFRKMLIMDLLAGAIIGALSGMGVGGAGLLVIYLTVLRGMGQTDAQGINLYFFLFASTAAMFIHVRKRKIDYKTVLLILAGGIPAAYFGCILASAVSPLLLRKVFGGMLAVTGVISLFSKKRRKLSE